MKRVLGWLVCAAVLACKAQSPATQPTPAKVTVTVSADGPGAISAAGFECHAIGCTLTAGDGAALHFTAAADSGADFNGWAGACSGAAACEITAHDGLTIRAAFKTRTPPPAAPPPPPSAITRQLTVSVTGAGTVRSDPAGIDCPGSCSAAFPDQTLVTLHAAPAAAFAFSGFDGACKGSSCALRLAADAGVWATFTALPRRTLIVTLDGDGGGRVVSAPAGIDCPGQCSATFLDGTLVSLSAAPDVISRFTQWAGDCVGAQCAQTLHADSAVRAQFDHRRYVVLDLGTLQNGYWSNAGTISRDGRYVAGDWGGPGGEFLYDGTMHDVAAGPGDARGVNSAGVVVGVHGGFTAFRWANGVATDLPSLGGTWGFAQAINDRGMIAGYSSRADGHVHAVIWNNGAVSDLGSLGGGGMSCSLGYGMDSRGTVVGESCVDAAGTHAARFRGPGLIDDLGTLGGAFGRAHAINDSGVIAGESSPPSGPSHGFVWQNGTMTDAGTLPGLDQSALFAINGSGVAVGVSMMSTGGTFRGVVYAAGQMIDLNTVVEPTPYTILSANGIDESGDIAAQGYDERAGGMRALVLKRE